MSTKKTVSVILGGGAGSRLYPLTSTRSKPAVPIAGKYRLVDIPYFKLHQQRHQQNVCAYTIQFRFA
jgi:ADP-glucose pyrophosphorylase